jgi:hypothetical protein
LLFADSIKRGEAEGNDMAVVRGIFIRWR